MFWSGWTLKTAPICGRPGAWMADPLWAPLSCPAPSSTPAVPRLLPWPCSGSPLPPAGLAAGPGGSPGCPYPSCPLVPWTLLPFCSSRVAPASARQVRAPGGCGRMCSDHPSLPPEKTSPRCAPGPSSEPVWTEHPGPQHCARWAGDLLVGGHGHVIGSAAMLGQCEETRGHPSPRMGRVGGPSPPNAFFPLPRRWSSVNAPPPILPCGLFSPSGY